MTARLLTGAVVRTPEPTPADSVAVRDGRIVALGTRSECEAALPEGATVTDLRGTTLVPGFVDAHLHPLVMCVFEQQLRLDDCRSVADVLDLVADRVPTDRTIMGFGLDDARLAEGRLPTPAELDAAGGGARVVLVRRDGHHAVGSAAALRAAGLDPATTVLSEAAVAPLLGLLDAPTFEDLQAGAAAWSARLLSQGVTAISAICQTTPEGPSGPAGELESLGWEILAPSLPFDIQTILIAPDLAAVDAARATALHDPAAGRRVDAVKLFLDGTLGGCTAAMHHAFADRDTCGTRTMDDGEARARAAAAHRAGLSVCIHAIGDAATAAAVDLLADVIAADPGPHRHRVEHASVLDARTIDRMGELGITAVVQPVNLRSEAHWLAARVGPERLGRTYPFRSMLDAGVPVAGSSDAPIEVTDVLAAMAASVDRGGLADEQAITAAEALAMYTTGGAAARRCEGDLGTIAVGARADLVVLSADPTRVGPAGVDVVTTIVGGIDRHSEESP